MALGLSSKQVVDALARDNRNVSAGDTRSMGRQVLVRSVGQWTSLDDIRNALVTVKNGQPIYVHDVAEVRDTFAEVDSDQWVDGQRGITMSISKQSGANTVDVAKHVREAIGEINHDYAGRARLSLLWDSSQFIRDSVTNVESGAMWGALLAIFVLIVFLRNMRATLVIATSIPLSVLAALALMYFAGYTLNVVSFGGLALGIGMLVDNAIVILENIYRKREEGLDSITAAMEGAREVAPAVLSGTLTTVVVFAPVVFIGGFASIFFGEMAAVVTFALLCSLAVAVTLVPAISGQLLRGGIHKPRGLLGRVSERTGRILDGLDTAYSRLVAAALRTPWFVVIAAMLLLVLSVRLAPLIGFELMPETDEGRVDVDVQLPVGTPIETTGPLMRKLEHRVVTKALKPGELEHILTSAGPSKWWQPGGSNLGSMSIHLVPVTERTRGVDAIVASIRKELSGVPDADIRIRKTSSNFLMRLMRGGQDERLVVEVRGHDLDTSRNLARKVLAAMQSVPGVTHAYVDREDGLEERAVHVDTARAADLGLSRADIADTVETYELGDVATKYRDMGDEFDVRVQLREQDRRNASQLESMPVLTPSGGSVPLGSVAHFDDEKGPTAIAREGQERLQQVLGSISGRPLGDIVKDLRKKLDRIAVPEGFALHIAGEQEEQQKTFGGLLIGIALAIFLVYTVMAVQFESVLHPLIIMAAVPFAAIGVILTLLFTGTTFNMNSFLGAIVLVGIVVNNAIVLVDYVNLLRREHGMTLHEALVEGARRRLRPILMTTLTTVLAMIPLALGIGEGSEVQAPLARVVLGGLLSSTLVTLVLIPCLYLLVERRRAAAHETAPALRAVERSHMPEASPAPGGE